MPKGNRKSKYRHSSTFYRKVQKSLEKNKGVNQVFEQDSSSPCTSSSISSNNLENLEQNARNKIEDAEALLMDDSELTIDNNHIDNYIAEVEDVPNLDEDDFNLEAAAEKKVEFVEQLREWCLTNKITHAATNKLLKILNTNGMSLPKDARTLLKTPASINSIVPLENGQYWYNGIKNCLLSSLTRVNENMTISLIFNIDGLPPYRSAPIELWPILMKIEKKIDLKPMIVAIYCGASKPPLQGFLAPFVEEAKTILEEGLIINNFKININIKYFVCDTPARSFIKGTMGFNAAHGCIKCNVVGEYDRQGRHMSFPEINCTLRTDESFRRQLDEGHHKEETPLINLPIDMVKSIIVADSLHLFDLGITRKCLYGWVNGSYNFKTKFSGTQINLVNSMLENCNKTKPKEIHRAIRGLKCLKFWKGTEYRTFVLYCGMVILKEILSVEAYQHFLMLSCVVAILSCKSYLKYINIADLLIKDYIRNYIILYGRDSISSNVHNLCHVIEDVKNFGNLSEISAYPFENFLGYLKTLLRSGNKPLPQIVKRVVELMNLESNANECNSSQKPVLTKKDITTDHELSHCDGVFHSLQINSNFLISDNNRNKWFLTKNDSIVSMINATYNKNKIHIFGTPLKFKSNFFDLPIKSSKLNIYKSNGEKCLPKLYSLDEVKCKLFFFELNNYFVFIPVLHTLDYEIL